MRLRWLVVGILGVCACLRYPDAARAATATVYPSSQGAVTSGRGDNNGFQTSAANITGAPDDLCATDTNSGSANGGTCGHASRDAHRAWAFDISAIPAGSTINSITPQAVISRAQGSAPNMCLRVSCDATCSTATNWSTYSGPTAVSAVSCASAATLGSTAVTGSNCTSTTALATLCVEIDMPDASAVTADYTLDALPVVIDYTAPTPTGTHTRTHTFTATPTQTNTPTPTPPPFCTSVSVLIATSDDDAETFTNDDVLPATLTTTVASLTIQKFELATVDIEQIGLLRFATDAVPDDANITGASLDIAITSVAQVGGLRSLRAQWDDGESAWTAADHIDTITNDAHSGTAVTSLLAQSPQYWTLALQNASANIDRTSYTGIVLGIDGDDPTASDYARVFVASWDHATAPEPRLNIDYCVPVPPPPEDWTHTPTDTITPTPTPLTTPGACCSDACGPCNAAAACETPCHTPAPGAAPCTSGWSLCADYACLATGPTWTVTNTPTATPVPPLSDDWTQTPTLTATATPVGISFIQEAETVWNTATTPKTTASFNVLAGDVLVAYAVIENDDSEPVTIAGGSLTWANPQTVNVVGYSWVSVWTATVDTDKAMTVTFTCTLCTPGSGNDFFGGNVLTFRGASAVGASSKTNVLSGAPTLNLTTTAATSAVVVVNADWNAVDGDGSNRTWRTNAGTFSEQTYFRDSSKYAVYGGHHLDAGAATTYAVGLSAPTGQKYSIIAVEVKD